LRDVGEKTQGAIEIRLAGAVRARDDVEVRQRHDDVAQRTVTADGDGGQQAGTDYRKYFRF
jgi:hypothetical protein